jgi:hypothetical protein
MHCTIMDTAVLANRNSTNNMAEFWGLFVNLTIPSRYFPVFVSSVHMLFCAVSSLSTPSRYFPAFVSSYVLGTLS